MDKKQLKYKQKINNEIHLKYYEKYIMKKVKNTRHNKRTMKEKYGN